ncbi:F-box domain protein [Aspergillus puulaauensis]|uniref:F-box domain-containing protein n=1 Tax=Aspergillus puulaauensis TaxID=1220207 RepID=A0A7R8AP90_9EURO|nr:uncharacterized protein APUU_51585A [Aspergillus puulaauensis]BCS26874.1 hypothetical protein APUU_51585A [Aspergillus puulaauensis]
MAKCPIFSLPREIHDVIIDYLGPPEHLHLRAVCQSFRELIPPLCIQQLLQVEVSDFGLAKDLYTCRDCMRLRPRAKFADNMVKKKKAKGCAEAGKRFCVECGTSPNANSPLPATARYTRGCHVVILGEHHVVCYPCGRFGLGWGERGVYMDECRDCQLQERFLERWTEAEAHKARQKRLA